MSGPRQSPAGVYIVPLEAGQLIRLGVAVTQPDDVVELRVPEPLGKLPVSVGCGEIVVVEDASKEPEVREGLVPPSDSVSMFD